MGAYLDPAGKKERISELQEKMAEAGFWDNPEEAQKVNQKIASLNRLLERWQKIQTLCDDAEVLIQLGLEEGDESLEEEAKGLLAQLSEMVSSLELEQLLSGPYDANSAILSIHPGAGGTESQDWASMLLRMYTRWAEANGYTVQTLDFLPGDEAGIKSVTLLISGENAYGYLKSEQGVHRLVRISPFDASGRRHTSFASVSVLPEVEADDQIQISPDELKIDTYRAGGAGGQHVNKTESAVRITHLPTGIVVQCQNERSQHSNREAAMKILQARLFELRQQEQQEKIDSLRQDQGEIAWGNQIRSYVFCPYTMVKDHRTGFEVGNVEAVMDGELGPFIEAYLRSQVAS
ncbi:MAG TPA: peptide chain release factor 2 [Bacillota bacterium]|nr:peptide chain release factor 2 [Bacillota bacterium]